MRREIFFILFFFASASYAQKNQVCFTIDDLPVVALSFKSNESQKAITIKILQALKDHKIPATGFVNEGKLYEAGKLDSTKIILLKMWLDAGMDLGNHGFAHLDYHRTNYTEYCNDIIKGEKISKPLMAAYGKTLKYFRHPYLQIGDSKEKADSLHMFLVKEQYIEAPVTIDNADWIFALAYDSAMQKKDTALMRLVGETYLGYMQKKVNYFESLSTKIFNRNIKQVLLIHANALNADYLDALAIMYERKNYEFISLSNALKDPAYLSKNTVYGRWGISWIERWAMSMGKEGEFFKNDPSTPDYIMQLAKTTHE
ncbi:MAG: polysaccharide deacetylase family protein [Ferruginibacter sp.]